LKVATQSLVRQQDRYSRQGGQLVVADMDGRFGDELVFLTTDCWVGDLDIVWSAGEGRFAQEPVHYYLSPEGPHSLMVEDLDGDGYRDVFWIVQQEASVDRLQVLWNDGNGGLGDLWTRYLSHAWAGSASAGDLDGDGIPDLAMPIRDFGTATYDRVGILYGDRLRAERKLKAHRGARPAATEIPGDGPRLRGTHPNPASGSVIVSFSTPRSDPADIELFDIAGRRVLVERLEGMAAGGHDVSLAIPGTLRNGVYWLALRQGGLVSTRRITVVR
jgi:hypothetical protein